MPKRKLSRASSSSDSDSDNECLIELVKKKSSCIAAQAFNINPLNSLCKPSQESCEFCDSSFSNRLEALVHNAKHIIIPLLRNSGFSNYEKDPRIENHNKPPLSQIVPSSNNLAIQKFNNKIILGNKNKLKPVGIKSRIVFEEDDDDVILISDSDNDGNTDDAKNPQTKSAKDDVLSNFVADCKVVLSDSMILFNKSKELEENSQITNGNDNQLLNSFTAECRVALGMPMNLEIETKNTQDGERKIVTIKRKNSTEKKCRPIENRTQSKEAKIITLKKKESIEKITHQFENMCLPLDKNKGNRIEARNTVQAADIFSYQNGFKTAFSCQKEAFKTLVEEKKMTENGRKSIPAPVKEGNDNFEPKSLPNTEVSIAAPIVPKIEETVQESVHYDDLQKPGLYKCDLCKYTFPNRFSSIQHRTEHLQIRTADTGYCIACEKVRCIPNSSVPLCFYCNYRHSWHNRENYINDPKNSTLKEYVAFKERHEDKTIKVCEVCSVFLQRLTKFNKKGNVSYKLTYSLMGDVWNNNDEPCDNCGKVYNQMKLINKSYATYPKGGESTKIASRIRYEETEKFDKNYLNFSKRCYTGKTNVDRLGRIRSRIKKLNFINKF